MPTSLPPEVQRRLSTPIGRLVSWVCNEAMEEIRLFTEAKNDGRRGVAASTMPEAERTARVASMASSVAMLNGSLARGDLDDPFAGWHVVQRCARDLGPRYTRMLDSLSEHERAQLSGLGARGALALNRSFSETLMAAGAPALALGVAEEGGERVGALALLLDGLPPPEISGCRVAPALVQDAGKVVGLQLSVEFPGFAQYHAIVDPTSLLVRQCVGTLVTVGRCMVFVVTANGRVGAFMVGQGDAMLSGMAAVWPGVRDAHLAPGDFQRAEFAFGQRRVCGSLMTWTCRSDPRHLDLAQDRLELRFSKPALA